MHPVVTPVSHMLPQAQGDTTPRPAGNGRESNIWLVWPRGGDREVELSVEKVCGGECERSRDRKVETARVTDLRLISSSHSGERTVVWPGLPHHQSTMARAPNVEESEDAQCLESSRPHFYCIYVAGAS